MLQIRETEQFYMLTQRYNISGYSEAVAGEGGILRKKRNFVGNHNKWVSYEI